MYLYVRDIDIVPSYNFSIRFWNCPDNGVFFSFSIYCWSSLDATEDLMKDCWTIWLFIEMVSPSTTYAQQAWQNWTQIYNTDR